MRVKQNKTMDKHFQFLIFSTLVFLVMLWNILDRPYLTRLEVATIRFIYYAYWYFLLWIDAPKPIVGLLIFGYAILNTFVSGESAEVQEAYTKAYAKGFRAGWMKCRRNRKSHQTSPTNVDQ